MDLVVIEWDGKHLPTELQRLPPGRYVVQAAQELEELGEDEEEGIRKALDQVAAGQVIALTDVLRSIRRENPRA